MNLLAIDTSSKACVLGLDSNGHRLCRSEDIDRSHSKEILPRILRLLADAEIQLSDLDGIVYGKGPGSFTGLRIGVGVTQGLAFGLGFKVASVSSLAALALPQLRQNPESQVFAALHARADEVYYGAYRLAAGRPEPLVPEAVAAVSDLAKLKEANWILVGTAELLQSDLETALAQGFDKVISSHAPEAEVLLDLGLAAYEQDELLEPELVLPEYLRETVASVPAK